MDLFIICFSLAALLYVLTLPFIGKRAKKEEIKPVFVFESWEVKAKRYDDAIKTLDMMKG